MICKRGEAPHRWKSAHHATPPSVTPPSPPRPTDGWTEGRGEGGLFSCRIYIYREREKGDYRIWVYLLIHPTFKTWSPIGLVHIPRSSIQNHYISYLLERGSDFFSFFLKCYWKSFFSWLNYKIYLYHLVVFLVLKFYFNIFLKLYIVSWIFLVFILFYKINLVLCFLKGCICVKRNPKYPLKELNLAKPPPSWSQGCSFWEMYGSKEGAYIFFRVWLVHQYMQPSN